MDCVPPWCDIKAIFCEHGVHRQTRCVDCAYAELARFRLRTEEAIELCAAGILGRTAEDAAALLRKILGFDNG